jgi:DNA-binding PucR family transcriptional regulator
VDALQLASARLLARTDIVVDALVQRWLAERERWAGRALARRGAIVQKLLAGEIADVASASAGLGYELDRTVCAAVLWDDAGNDAEAALAGLEELAAALARAAGAGRALTLPAGAAVLWAWVAAEAPPSVAALAAAMREAARAGQGVALGTPGPGLDGFRHGHAEALAARRVVALAGRPARVLRYDEVEAVSLMAEDPERLAHFVRRTLGALAAPGESAARLRRTLRAWLAAGGSAPAAAVRLGVHKNTVLYRVHRAQALLPRPVDDDRLAVELALAVAEEVGLDRVLAPA